MRSSFLIKNWKPISATVSIFYFALLTILDVNLFLATFIMSVSLFLGMVFIYDIKSNMLSIRNVFFLMLFVLGFFFRYFLILLDKSVFMDFYASFDSWIDYSATNHIKTALYLLLTISILSVTFSILKKNHMNPCSTDNYGHDHNELMNPFIVVIYLVLLFAHLFYQFKNMKSAVSEEFGLLDNLFNSIGVVAQLFAYSLLAQFFKNHKRKAYLVLYLLYALPTIIASIVMMWKGTLIFELIVFAMAANMNKRRIKLVFILMIIVGLYFVVPIVTMAREAATHSESFNLSFATYFKYLKENSILKTVSTRFAYYDETYLCANTSYKDILQYRNSAGGIFTRIIGGIIPRTIWPNKPIVNSGRFTTYIIFRYPSTVYNNLTMGIVAECFVSYSVFGLLFFMPMLAFLVTKINSLKYKNKAFSTGFYLVLSKILFSFFEGDIAAKTITLLIALIAAVLASFALSLFVKKELRWQI